MKTKKPQQRLPERKPAILVSFVYLKNFLPKRPLYDIRDWALDSGAFSAHTMGIKIHLIEYIEKAKELIEKDPQLVEVFALDVIGDWRGSLANTEQMWKADLQAIPCYHYGEPWDVLTEMANTYPKIAIGGVALKKGAKKHEWARQCFARVWPKKIHGFGFGSAKIIMELPFHSVDATNWELAPCRFGRWPSYGGAALRWRGGKQDLRAEVEYWMRVEANAQARWTKEMAKLETLAPTVRLGWGWNQQVNRALQEQGPSIRLSGPCQPAMTDALASPSIRLSCVGQAQGEINGALGPNFRLSVGGAGGERYQGNLLKR